MPGQLIVNFSVLSTLQILPNSNNIFTHESQWQGYKGPLPSKKGVCFETTFLKFSQEFM
jgi:hypothetical protein